MLPGDRLVCAFVEPQPVGTRFKDWPLHVTIVPWFRMELSSEALTCDFHQALVKITPFDAQVADPEQFGYNGTKMASLIRQPAAFTELEKQVRGSLKRHHVWLVDETTKRHRPYRPHVTFQKAGHLNKGDSFRCDSLYIVEQNGDYKEIVSRVELGHEQQTKA